MNEQHTPDYLTPGEERELNEWDEALKRAESGWTFMQNMAGEQDCYCWTCLQNVPSGFMGMPITVSMMVVCPDCGNKRCPHATHHDNPCTNSNEVGQEGSRYTAPPPYLEGETQEQYRARMVEEFWKENE